MAASPLSRRSVLHLGLLSGLGLLTGCGAERPLLMATRGDLSTAWARSLPGPWDLRLLEEPASVLVRASDHPGRKADLIQLSDGWATTLPVQAWRPIGSEDVVGQMAPMAAAVSRLFAPKGAPVLAFPWSVSPWVIALRNRPDLVRRASEGWNLLLDPTLRGRLVLPSSPRVAIALMEEDPTRLRRLRSQALAYDDRDGLNLLLSRDADAAVVPRQRVVPLLRRDPRLQVLLPEEGSPLSWNLLLRPAGGTAEPPTEWLAAVQKPPLLPRLLGAGWVPPLPRAHLEQTASAFPESIARLLLPDEDVLERCRSLPPLAPAERERLQALWDASVPSG